MFQTVIPRNVRLAEAPSHGMPALAYDANAKGTKAYLALAEELLERTKGWLSLKDKVWKIKRSSENLIFKFSDDLFVLKGLF